MKEGPRLIHQGGKEKKRCMREVVYEEIRIEEKEKVKLCYQVAQ